MISIVIPAYNRTGTLFEAIQSCFAQAYRPIEIIVGDDSTTDAVQDMVAAIACPAGVTLRHERHAKQRGQSGNVNWLFGAASGARLVLLHDDDLLLPGGLDRLDAEWHAQPSPGCVFGKQIVILQDGAVDVDQTLYVNRRFFRADRPTGPQRPPEWVGLVQQIPNNCYLIDTALARACGYRQESDVGYAVDADFGIRLAGLLGSRDFVYVDAYVSAYRISHVSMMRSIRRNQDHHLFYRYVEGLVLPPEAEAARSLCLDRHGPSGVLDAANAGDIALARRIFASRHFGRSRMGIHGMLARLSIASPRAGAALRPWLKTGIQTLNRLAETARLRSRGATRGDAAERAAVEALAAPTITLARERNAMLAALTPARSAA